MRIALDPFMHRHLSLEALPAKVKALGYDWIELSPRADFFEWFRRPRVYPARVKSFKRALKDADVKIATLLPMYRWASPDEDERRTAVENWKRAIAVAVEMEVDTMNSEFGRGPHPDGGQCCPSCHGGGQMNEFAEEAWWRSIDELMPIFEREGIQLNIEPHPEDWVETYQPAVDFVRTVGSKNLGFLYCTPHTFYFGDDTRKMLLGAADVLRHVHIADTFNHKASSGLRYIVNPPGSTHRVHQHLDVGQGEVPWETFFATLGEIGFDGIMTVCVFAWEERADDSARVNLEKINGYMAKYFKKRGPEGPKGT